MTATALIAEGPTVTKKPESIARTRDVERNGDLRRLAGLALRRRDAPLVGPAGRPDPFGWPLRTIAVVDLQQFMVERLRFSGVLNVSRPLSTPASLMIAVRRC